MSDVCVVNTAFSGAYCFDAYVLFQVCRLYAKEKAEQKKQNNFLMQLLKKTNF